MGGRQFGTIAAVTARGGEQRIPRPPNWVPGPAPPWATVGERASLTEGDIRRRLAAHQPGEGDPLPFAIRRSAAVLVPLFNGPGGPTVVLTRRPWAMRAHSGEVCFPGGSQDRDDADLRFTALREAWEEIGLPPERVELIGQLDALATRTSGAWITPYVGFTSDLGDLHPSAGEVAAILRVPLEELLDPEVYHEELWPEPAGGAAPFEHPSGLRRMHFFELEGDTVWGATARMLFQLLVIATGSGANARPGEPGWDPYS
jgi:8-oxo-dGTP pyrophosphatase MutT (NUDIX family)